MFSGAVNNTMKTIALSTVAAPVPAIAVAPATIEALAAVSSGLSLLAILAYLFFVLQARRAARSIREIVEGEGLLNSRQWVEILRVFQDDVHRLAALKELTGHDAAHAERLYRKVQGRVNLGQLDKRALQNRRKGLVYCAVLFGVLGGVGFAYGFLA